MGKKATRSTTGKQLAPHLTPEAGVGLTGLGVKPAITFLITNKYSCQQINRTFTSEKF